MIARYIGVYALEEPLFPTLRFDIELEREEDVVGVWILGGMLDLIMPGVLGVLQERRVKVADLNRPIYCAFDKPRKRIQVEFDFEPWRLEKLEELRGGGDLWLRISLRYSKVTSSGSAKQEERMNVIHEQYDDRIKIAKSEWVEGILPKLGLRRVRLIEVPVLEPIPTEFMDVVSYIEEAWKCYLRGDYDDAITNCRRSLEAIATAVKKVGYEKRVTDEKGEERPVPDWKKVFGHETLAESFEKIFRGCFAFTQPGSHIGRAVARKEAELAVHTTYSIANYIVKTIVKD